MYLYIGLMCLNISLMYLSIRLMCLYLSPKFRHVCLMYLNLGLLRLEINETHRKQNDEIQHIGNTLPRAPKTRLPDGSKSAQDASRTAPRAPKMPPGWFQEPPKMPLQWFQEASGRVLEDSKMPERMPKSLLRHLDRPPRRFREHPKRN